jgi:hypothetical protein
MQQIEEYYIVTSPSNEVELSDYVNEYISKGWQPLGSPFTSRGSYTDDFHQAIVKYTTKSRKI